MQSNISKLLKLAGQSAPKRRTGTRHRHRTGYRRRTVMPVPRMPIAAVALSLRKLRANQVAA